MNMPQIIIRNLFNRTITSNETTQVLLETIHQAGIDWMHACGGKGKCTTCAARVIRGMEHLSEESEAELRFRREGRLPEGYRLACQTQVMGTVELAVPAANKLPHVNYGVTETI